MLSRTSFFLCALVLTLTSAAASATPVTVQNYSFESPVVPSDGNPNTISTGDDTINGAPTSWLNNIGGVLTRKSGSFFNNKFTPTPDPADNANEQMAWSNGGSYMYQVLAANVAAGVEYTLQVDLGIRSDVPVFPGADIRLGAGTTQGVNVFTPVLSFTNAPVSGDWSTWYFKFRTDGSTPGLGQSLRVELHSNGVQVSFDNVRLDVTTIPEAAPTLLLSVLGVALCVAWQLRRRAAAGN